MIYHKAAKSLQHCATCPLLLQNQHNLRHEDIITSTTSTLYQNVFKTMSTDFD